MEIDSLTNPSLMVPTDSIRAYCQRNGIRRLSLFGSALRPDFRSDSDVDLLVDFQPDAGVGFLALARMQRELSDLFHRKSIGFLGADSRPRSVGRCLTMPRTCMRSDRLYLTDIVEAVDAIEAFICGVDVERFVRDDLVRSAVLHKLTVIGEAAARVSMPLRTRFAEVPWGDIVGFRNIAVHAYFSVDWSIVWQAAASDAPSCENRLRRSCKPHCLTLIQISRWVGEDLRQRTPPGTGRVADGAAEAHLQSFLR
jgi:uncharacterized protein with HEPN domain/predicted nucleotidyltransferase